jgi:hypothetical protein
MRDKVRITFTHVGQGLAFQHATKVQGFALAGEDKKFFWADPVIEGDSIVIACDKVSKPVAVRPDRVLGAREQAGTAAAAVRRDHGDHEPAQR